jgi:hypothetical protein
MNPRANVQLSKINEAIETLRRLSFETGLGGELGDFDVALAEDNQTVSIWAWYESANPLIVHVMLDEPAQSIEREPIYAQLIAAQSPQRLLN